MVHSDPSSPVNNPAVSPSATTAPSILTVRMIMQGKVSQVVCVWWVGECVYVCGGRGICACECECV
jgi:hypothetical protein